MKLKTTFTAALMALTAAMTALPEAAEAAAYSIASGDLLSVTVYRQDDMSYRVRVDPEGYIRFPVAGRVYVAGNAADAIERTIAAALRKHGYSQPEVVVSVEAYAPRNVFVLGPKLPVS